MSRPGYFKWYYQENKTKRRSELKAWRDKNKLALKVSTHLRVPIAEARRLIQGTNGS